MKIREREGEDVKEEEWKIFSRGKESSCLN